MRVLVVGLGSMGNRRIRILKRFFSDQVQIIRGADSQSSRRNDCEELHQITCYLSLDEALAKGKYDCAFLCTSPQHHDELALNLLSHGVSVFSEINLINHHHKDILQLLKNSTAKYFLSSTPLYSEDRQYIQKYLQNEKRLTYQYHVGQYLPDWHPWENYKSFFVGDAQTNGCREIMVIELPWLLSVFGEIESLYVQKKKNTQLELSYPDTYTLCLTHKNGTVGLVCFDVVSRIAVRELTVFNENMYLSWHGTVNSISILDKQEKKMHTVALQAKELHFPEYANFINEVSYVREIQAFFDYLLHSRPPLHDLKKDIQILELADQIEGKCT